MSIGFLPFVLIPLLVYTYFWVNPIALAAFLEGVTRYIVEIYLGYKAWRVEYETRKAFRYFQKQSQKLAEERGLSKSQLADYFNLYGKDDWNFLYQREKEEFELKNRDLEREMKEMILF